MKTRLQLFFLYVCFSVQLIYSQNTITLEDIWLKFKFRTNPPPSFTFTKEGNFYITEDEKNNIIKKDLLTGNITETLVALSDIQKLYSDIKIEDYQISPQEKYLLIFNQRELIYRHSSKFITYLWDIKNKKLILLSNGEKIMFPKFSNDETKIAYIKNNNIYFTDLTTLQETPVTIDGEWNKIKNGWADWVYEEEFGKPDLFEWSNDGNYIAYLKFNESKVKEYVMDIYNNNAYPDKYSFKYPKAGEDNSEVTLWIFNLKSKENKIIPTDNNFQNIYIPRIKWLQHAHQLCYITLNRHQNHLQMFLFNPSDFSVKKIFEEQSDTYIEINDNWQFVNKDKEFLWLSNKNGFQHIYRYDISGKLINPVTSGNFDIESILDVDETKKEIYYTSTENSVINRPVYKITFDGKKKTLISPAEGFNNIQLSPDKKYFILFTHSANTPPVYSLYQNKDNKFIKMLENNQELIDKMKNYSLSKKEFYTFKNRDGIELHYWIMKPVNFDSNNKHPVFVTAYNGPGINKVNNAWEYEYWFHQFLCQNGYIVACADGRGTFGKGKSFWHCTYLQLGKLETEDQTDFIRYLKQQSYVDKNKIFFEGWSYGGFMALNMITKAPDEIKGAISIAPVSNWKFYDNIYTERYMRLPKENPHGYNELSPINFVKNIKGKLLLIHGTADDNVHLQNAMEFVKECVNQNKSIEYFVYPNKNHGIYGGYTRLHLYSMIYNFLQKN
ncbi:MAG: S9 family peptidase [Bacteroidia bacterium]|nr:S9 family peptidase [Bacteroidia bacterium]